MKELIGKTIEAVYENEDNTFLAFLVSDTTIYLYEATEDCCCSSWFESILNVENMIGSPILDVEEKLVTLDGNTEVEIDWNHDNLEEKGYESCIGYTIKTLKGHTDIEHKSDVMPYYEGECKFIGVMPATMSDKGITVDTSLIPAYIRNKNIEMVKVS